LKSTKRTKSQKERKKEINQEKNLQINPSIATTVNLQQATVMVSQFFFNPPRRPQRKLDLIFAASILKNVTK
jgi:hypothetical protein